MTATLPSLTLVRRIKAPPAKVFAALTRPEQMILWWSPDGGQTLSAEADLRPGGRFSVVFRMLGGDERNPTGVYQTIEPDRKLVFTWDFPGVVEAGSLVTFLLRPIDEGTELTLTHEQLPDEATRTSHEAGWSGLLRELSTFLGDAQ